MYLIPIMCFQIYQVVPEGEMLAVPERILQVHLQHLRNRSFRRFLIKWERLSWKWGIMGVRKWVQRNLPKFCHCGHWLNLRGKKCNELIGKCIVEDGNKLQGWMFKTKKRGWSRSRRTRSWVILIHVKKKGKWFKHIERGLKSMYRKTWDF